MLNRQRMSGRGAPVLPQGSCGKNFILALRNFKVIIWREPPTQRRIFKF
jgi:hypothetical protein